MKTFIINTTMSGARYFLGMVFGIVGGEVGGEVLTSINSAESIEGVDMLGLVTANSSGLTGEAFFTRLMGGWLVIKGFNLNLVQNLEA